MTDESRKMFEKIRAFLTVYMPKQRGLSSYTIKSYKQCINQFLTYITQKKKVRYDEISFRNWDASTISDYLVYLENDRNMWASDTIQRLFAIRSFVKYDRIFNTQLFILLW